MILDDYKQFREMLVRHQEEVMDKIRSLEVDKTNEEGSRDLSTEMMRYGVHANRVITSLDWDIKKLERSMDQEEA